MVLCFYNKWTFNVVCHYRTHNSSLSFCSFILVLDKQRTSVWFRLRVLTAIIKTSCSVIRTEVQLSQKKKNCILLHLKISYMYRRIFKDYFDVQTILALLILRSRFFSLGDCTKCRTPRKN
jgi:hypothetical protein